MPVRLAILVVMFLCMAAYNVRATQPERVPPREPIQQLPLSLSGWQGRDLAPFAKEIIDVLGVDEYVSRVYARPGEPYITLYLGYYQSQREGDTIHSPMNCLPGAGWEPIVKGLASIPVAGEAEPISVNRIVIRKGADRQLVLYWYQSHGRVVANEYWSKVTMVYDAFRLNRSDAALVRVVTPVLPLEADDAAAEQRAVAFVKALYPELGRFLPD